MSETTAAAPALPQGLTWEQVMGQSAPAAGGSAAPGGLTYDQVMALPATKTPEKKTGYLSNVWGGVLEGIAALSSVSEMSPWRTAAEALGIETPSVSRNIAQSPQVAGVEPGSPGEGAARAATRGAVTLLGPGAVSKGLQLGAQAAGAGGLAAEAGASPLIMNPATATTLGAGGSLAGAAAADVVPEEWKDVAETGATLAATLGLVAGGAAARSVGRTIRGQVQASTGLGGGAAAPIVNPETGQPFTTAATTGVPGAAEPVVATPHEMALAGQRIARAAGQSPEELLARIPTGPWGETPPPPVPGSQPSLGQTTGDVGVLGLERTLRTRPYGREAATVTESRNNLARVAALEGAAPADVGSAAGDFLRAQLQAMQHEHETATAAGRAAVGEAAEAAGMHEPGPGVAGPEQMGEAARTALEARRLPQKAAAGRALDALAEDQTLAVDGSDLGAEARRIVKEEVGEGGALRGPETGPLDAASSYRGVVPFSRLRSLLGSTSEALREIRATPGLGAESAPYRRMSMLMTAIHKAITDAAERAVVADVTSGAAPGSRIVDRLVEGPSDAAAGAAADATGRGVAQPVSAGGTPGAAGQGGAVAPVNAAGAGKAGGPGGARGAGGVEAELPAANRPRRPETLLDWIISNGGIKPDADLRAMDADKYHHRHGGRLVNPAGPSADYVREGAVEQGFLKQGADINDLRKAIADSLAGNHVVRPEEAATLEAWQRHNAETGQLEARRSAAETQVMDAEHAMGARLSQHEIDHAVDMMVRDPDLHPEAALREAVRAGEEGLLRSYSAREAMGPPGVSQAAEQGELGVQGPLAENMTAAKAQQLRESNRQYAQYKETWRSGAVGDVLQSGARGFKLSDAEVPAKLFRAGDKGAAAADSLIKAAGGVAEAQRVLGDYPALVLRDMAMRDGVMNEAGYGRFLRQYGPTLAKFPELAARFRTVAEAQRQVDAAAARGVERLRAYQDSAAKYYLGKGEDGAHPITAIGNLLRSENAPAAARDLMARVRANDAARDGVQNNAIRWVLQQAEGTLESGTTGERELRNAPIQRILNHPQMSAALREMLTPAQFRTLVTVGQDLDVANRAVNAVKIPGSPGTAADMHAVLHEGGHRPSQFAVIWASEKLGTLLGHVLGLGAFTTTALEGVSMVAAGMMRAARAAGYDRVLDLATEAVHNPALGRVVLRAAIEDAKAPIMRHTMQQLVGAAAGIGAASQSPRER